MTTSRAKNWQSPAELKAMYRSASILKGGKVVFDIARNKYRVMSSVHYGQGTISLTWFCTQRNYNKINGKEIKDVPD